jgi:23S rRNA-/tRNA-specific pseudouridylate synthase
MGKISAGAVDWMREYTIEKNDAGQRLDRWLGKTLPLLPPSLAQKYIRLKRIKVNGKKAARDLRLAVGDLVQLYINDEFFETPTRENAFLSLWKPQLDILYEDENLLLINKRPGLVVHPDEEERVNTLITHIQAYLYQKKEWNPYSEHSFAPALCNRIDRNTGGIVMAAKNAETLRILNQKIRDREVEKRYLCIVHGAMEPTPKLSAERRGEKAGFGACPCGARRPYRRHPLPHPGIPQRSFPGGVHPHHRAHPSDSGPVRRRRPSPAGRRQVWQSP